DRTQRDHTAVLVPTAPGIIDDAFRSGHLPRIEAALHTRATTPGPHLRRVRTATGQQVQPAGHHRLTGPGFTGDRGESLIQLQQGVLDHPELLDAHLGQHAVHTTNLHYSARPNERVRSESARRRTRSTLVAFAPTLHRQIELVHQPIRERLIA